MQAPAIMEGTGVAILGTLAFCFAGCADIWQFEDLQVASDAQSAESGATLNDAASAEASDGSAAVLAVAPAPNPVEAAVDLARDAASEANCPTCITSALAIMCMGPKSACSGQCVDTKSDTKNCGGCGIACSSGWTCHKGMCKAD